MFITLCLIHCQGQTSLFLYIHVRHNIRDYYKEVIEILQSIPIAVLVPLPFLVWVFC